MVRITTLPNGLALILEKKKSNSVTIQVSVHMGSNFERSDQAGISHFVEHLIFEGTTTRSAKEIATSIENTGGEFNAFTTNEYTAFHIRVPTQHKKLAIEILLDIVENSVFESKRVEKERKVILEELKLMRDEPTTEQWRFFLEQLFKDHPAARPIIGYEKTVKSITRRQLINFYRKYYVPKNMVISAVGDVSARDFAGFKRLKGEEIKHHLPPIPVNKARCANKKRLVQQTYYVRGWPVCGFDNPDRYALDVLCAVLNKGLSGRLIETLRNERGLAYTVGATYEPKSCYGVFALYITCTKKNLKQVKELMSKEIEQLENIPLCELEEAKSYLIGKNELEMEDPLERCDSLAESYFMKAPALDAHYAKKINKVSLADLERVRKKYLVQGATEVSING